MARRKSDFIPDKRIQRAAETLLSDFSAQGGVTVPPYPLEDIIWFLNDREGLSLDDSRDLGFDPNGEKILGKTIPAERLILIDPDTKNHPYYRFTLGHELGHWILHCRNIVELDSQTTLFPMDTRTFVTLNRDLKAPRDPKEIQANKFSAYILMPENDVREAFQKAIGGPQVLSHVSSDDDLRECARASARRSLPDGRLLWEHFDVSVESLAVRIQQLRLVSRENDIPILG